MGFRKDGTPVYGVEIPIADLGIMFFSSAGVLRGPRASLTKEDRSPQQIAEVNTSVLADAYFNQYCTAGDSRNNVDACVSFASKAVRSGAVKETHSSLPSSQSNTAQPWSSFFPEPPTETRELQTRNYRCYLRNGGTTTEVTASGRSQTEAIENIKQTWSNGRNFDGYSCVQK